MTKSERRRQTKAWCVVISIAIVIFGLGVLLGICIASKAAPEETATAETVVTEPLITNTQEAEDAAAPVSAYRSDIPLSEELQAVTRSMCEAYEVPLALILAIMERESNFNPDAVSRTNDYGLMQINKINFENLLAQGIDPLTYEGNIEAGCKILGEYIKRYGDIELALMAYNCGPTGARRLWDAGTHSTAYSRAVKETYEKWQEVLEQ